MLNIEHVTDNYALVSDGKGYGKRSSVIRYDVCRLHKYCELLLYPNWPLERVLDELCDSFEIELMLAFPKEAEETIKEVALVLVESARRNIHDPRTNK